MLLSLELRLRKVYPECMGLKISLSSPHFLVFPALLRHLCERNLIHFPSQRFALTRSSITRCQHSPSRVADPPWRESAAADAAVLCPTLAGYWFSGQHWTQPAIAFFALGGVSFIPGVYALYIAYRAYRGDPGFSFDMIPAIRT